MSFNFCRKSFVFSLSLFVSIYKNFWPKVLNPSNVQKLGKVLKRAQNPAFKPEQRGNLKSAFIIYMPDNASMLQQAFDQSPALKPESSIKTRIQR